MVETVEIVGEEIEEQVFDFMYYYLEMIAASPDEEEALIALYDRHKASFGRSIEIGGDDVMQPLIEAWRADKEEAEDIGPCFTEAAGDFFENENLEEENPFEGGDSNELERSWMIEAAYRDLICQLGFEPE